MDKSLLFKKQQKSDINDNTYKLAVFSNKHYKYFVILGVVVVMLIGYFFILKPKMSHIEDLKKQQQEKEAIFMNREKEWINLKNQVDMYSSLEQKDIDLLDDIMPKRENMEELMAYIDILARKNGFLVANINISDSKAKKNASEANSSEEKSGASNNIGVIGITFSISGNGTYSGLKNFLSTLESSARIIDVKKIAYTPNGGITIECSMYYSE